MSAITRITRRRLLKAAGAAATGLALPAVWSGGAGAAEQITVADVGGAPGAALRTAFYDPFEKATGIRVEGVAHESDPVTQFKVIVDTGSKLWDVCMVTPDDVLRLTQEKNYLEPLEVDKGPDDELIPGALMPNWFGFSAYGIVMAYRTDIYKKEAPTGWADFWNTTKFPGRRGLYRNPKGVLEAALLADGVAPKDLYPLDVDRAFKMMDKIRSEVAVWWSAGAQNTQILQNGEVDMTDTWSARAFCRNRFRRSGQYRLEGPLLDRRLVDSKRLDEAETGPQIRGVLDAARAPGGLFQHCRQWSEQPQGLQVHYARTRQGASDAA